MEKIEIPLSEYNSLKEEIEILKNNALLEKMNKLIDFMFKEKYGLYMGDYTDDLTEFVVSDTYSKDKTLWDDI